MTIPPYIIQPTQVAMWQAFYPHGSTTIADGWQTYNKPVGSSWIYIHMQAAGSSGGKGSGAAQSLAPGGGGSGGTTRLLIPSFLVPDILWVRPGKGGARKTVAGNGNQGTVSYVNVVPVLVAAGIQSLMNQSAGGPGSGSASNAAGSAGTVGAITSQAWASLGHWTSIAGQAGTAGAASSNGNGTTLLCGQNGILPSGGAGGGCGTGLGGYIQNALGIDILAGGAGTTGGFGSHGFNIGRPVSFNRFMNEFNLLYSGGGGGGGHTTGAAGDGGDGSWGSGGGGGGGASGTGSSGNGGAGGDGYILIGSF